MPNVNKCTWLSEEEKAVLNLKMSGIVMQDGGDTDSTTTPDIEKLEVTTEETKDPVSEANKNSIGNSSPSQLMCLVIYSGQL